MGKINYKYNYKKFSYSPLMIFIHGMVVITFWALLNRYYFFKGYSVLAQTSWTWRYKDED